MEVAERLSIPRFRVGVRVDPRDVCAWLLPFFAIVYLGLNNGGYDVIERSEVGMVVWWILLLGTVVGVLSLSAATRVGYAMLLILFAFAAWTALSLIWTESSERTLVEVARVLTYSGFFALALTIQGDGRWRHMLAGVTAAVVFICAIAVLSRLEPTWFPAQATGRFFSGIGLESRLAYPLNYSSGLGAVAALGLTLLLGATALSRTLVMQASAAAAMPLCALTLWLSGSGLAVPIAVITMLAFLTLAPDRLPKLASILTAAAGSAILFAADVQRAAFDNGFTGQAAQKQGHEMLALILVVCVGVGLVQAGLSLAVRHGHRPPWLMVSREQARLGVAGLLVVLFIGIAVAGASGGVSSAWSHFKSSSSLNPSQEDRASSILDYSSSGRYAFWRSAVRANEAHPWVGTGAGTFQFWWTRDRTTGPFVRDAHSLYFQALAELGIVGFLLIGSFSVGVLCIGGIRALRSPPAVRIGIATAAAGCVGFVIAAMIDWMWEIAVLPLIFLSLAAIICGPIEGSPVTGLARSARRWRPNTFSKDHRVRRFGIVAFATVCLLGLAANLVPLASLKALIRSRGEAGSGRLQPALKDARNAVALQPYASTPHLQEALVLEELGNLDQASVAVRKATQDEPTNWSTWLIRSRIEARVGNINAALRAYRRAKSLNPQSSIFQQ